MAKRRSLFAWLLISRYSSQGIDILKHTFLVDAGRWTFKGHWLERDQAPLAVEGKILVAWSQANWFTMVSKMQFKEEKLGDDLVLKYRGRLDGESRHYTFILKHSQLGPVEGEGWVTPNAIVQRFWSLEDRQRRGGFETIHYVNDNRYLLSSSIMAGHHLLSTFEATLDRQLR